MIEPSLKSSKLLRNRMVFVSQNLYLLNHVFDISMKDLKSNTHGSHAVLEPGNSIQHHNLRCLEPVCRCFEPVYLCFEPVYLCFEPVYLCFEPVCRCFEPVCLCFEPVCLFLQFSRSGINRKNQIIDHTKGDGFT